jgi:hypothetical protein
MDRNRERVFGCITYRRSLKTNEKLRECGELLGPDQFGRKYHQSELVDMAISMFLAALTAQGQGNDKWQPELPKGKRPC